MALTFVTGGARSGKSSLALRLAAAAGDAGRDDRDGRGARRRDARAHRGPPPRAAGVLAHGRGAARPRRRAARTRRDEFAIVDCLSLWVSNLLERAEPAAIEQLAAEAAALAAAHGGGCVAVSNEVGMGIVPAERARALLPRRSRARQRHLGRRRGRSAVRRRRSRAAAGARMSDLLERTIAADRRARRGGGRAGAGAARPEDEAARLARRARAPGRADRGHPAHARRRRSARRSSSSAPPTTASRPRASAPIPSSVTAQMVANYAAGGAAVSVLARRAGARLVVVDCGVAEPLPVPGVLDRRLGAGTASMLRGPAMTREQAIAALETGIALAAEELGGAGCVALGEMGIGNSTAAAALTCALAGATPEQACGRGTGLDDAGLARKRDVVARALELMREPGSDRDARVRPGIPLDPIGVARGRRRIRARRARRAGARRGQPQHPGRDRRLSGLGRRARRGRARACAAGVADRRAPLLGAGARASCSSTSACSRCSTSTCASARAVARRSPCRCWAPRSRSSTRWRRSPPRASTTAGADDRRGRAERAARVRRRGHAAHPPADRPPDRRERAGHRPLARVAAARRARRSAGWSRSQRAGSRDGSTTGPPPC